MVQILSTVFLVSGLIAIFIGTIGVFGYSFKTVVTRRQAVTILFAGLFSLIIAGRFNLQTIPDINSQQPLNSTGKSIEYDNHITKQLIETHSTK